MRNLIAFFLRHHVLFVFILLETIAMGMLLQSHYYQSSRFASSASNWSGQLLDGLNNSKEYLSLKEVNVFLAEENALLKSRKVITSENAQISKENYQYTAAKVIKNSFNKRSNYLTLNKGTIHGIESGMGVCTKDGVVGIVRDVSKHYATVMSVLNKNTVISTRLSKSNHFGELHWDGKSKDFAQLKSIEKYVPISVGDSLVTNSYSSIFPEGISIGTINRFERDQAANFYSIEVDLSVDYTNIDFVYVIKDAQKLERKKLESQKSE
tara:strand:- start:262 stop:1062 length:801 start_codon:yes stop_codon:yes gene_type:complete